jgi:hypothetical protein
LPFISIKCALSPIIRKEASVEWLLVLAATILASNN